MEATGSLDMKTRSWVINPPDGDLITASTAHRLIGHLEKRGWVLVSKTSSQFTVRKRG